MFFGRYRKVHFPSVRAFHCYGPLRTAFVPVGTVKQCVTCGARFELVNNFVGVEWIRVPDV